MKPPLEMILPLLLEASMLRVAIATECSSPLGMESRAITDNQISASSSYNQDWLPKDARLNNNKAWSPRTSSGSQWLQIDLLERKDISGIQTQGLLFYYVKSFKLSYCDDGTNWNSFQENGSDKIFVGNSNAIDVKENNIDPPIRARFIRLMAETWEQEIAFRLELLGCEIQAPKTQMSSTTTTTFPVTYVTTMSFMTTQKQPTQRVPTSSIKLTTATIQSSASTVQQTTSPISFGPGTSPPSFNNTSGNSEVDHRAGTISGAIIGGAVVAAVVIISSAVVVSIFIVRRRPFRNTEGNPLVPEPQEMGRHNIRGPDISEDGEYVDTLPSNVNSRQTGTDNDGYLIPIRILQQSGTSGVVLENGPPAPPSEHLYEELRY